MIRNEENQENSILPFLINPLTDSFLKFRWHKCEAQDFCLKPVYASCFSAYQSVFTKLFFFCQLKKVDCKGTQSQRFKGRLFSPLVVYYPVKYLFSIC